MGGTCLVDFMGHPSAKWMASYFHDLWDLVEETREAERAEWGDVDPDGHYSKRYIFLASYLALVNRVIEQYGWLSRGAARESYDRRQATADIAIDIYYAKERERKDTERRPEDWAAAEAAIEWAKNLPESERQSDYMNNIHVLANTGSLEHRDVGLGASILATYQRHMEFKRTGERTAHSEWVGELKKRQEFTVEVLATKYIDTDYGGTTLYRMVDPSGNVLVWFCSGSCIMEEQGTYHIKGTVKEHNDFRGTKQTIVNRCKVEEVISVPSGSDVLVDKD